MAFIEINGLELHYREQGQGPAAVLLHGLGSSSADWQLQLPALARAYRVLAPDLRAHGQSGGLQTSFSVGTLADDIAALLARLKIGSAHVAGLSLGGCVAQRLALRHPAQVRSLTLVNTFARLRPAGLYGLWRMLRRAWLLLTAPSHANAAYIAQGLFPQPEQAGYRAAAIASFSRNSKRTYLAVFRALLSFDLRPELARITCPTLVITGDRDTTIALAAKEELARLIPGARLVVLRDSGHATPIDQAERFNQTVLDFWEQV